MDYDRFSTIVRTSRHVRTLIFRSLKLVNRGIIDFGKNLNYNINTLSLQQPGIRRYNDLARYRAEFYYIVDQIRNSNIHKQLEIFDIYGCNVDTDEVYLPGVQVIDE